MKKFKRNTALLFMGLLAVLANDVCLYFQLSDQDLAPGFFIISSIWGVITYWLFKKKLEWKDIAWYLVFPLALVVFVFVARLELWFIGVFMFVFILLGITFPTVSKSLKPYILGSSLLIMGTLYTIAPSYTLKQGKEKIAKSISLNQVKYVSGNTKDSILMKNIFNKTTILVTWTASCGACKREIQDVVNELCKKNSKDVAVFAINVKDDWQKAVNFQSKFCPTIIGSRNFREAIGVNGVPSLLLLSADGEIVYTHHGYICSTKDDLIAEVQGEIDKLQN